MTVMNEPLTEAELRRAGRSLDTASRHMRKAQDGRVGGRFSKPELRRLRKVLADVRGLVDELDAALIQEDHPASDE
jgi:hypothetical protein